MANLPPFTPEDPTHWLKLCDAHFNLKKIESPQEKIYAIITSLTYELQRELDVALGYTTEEQYKEFKVMLLAATACQFHLRTVKHSQLSNLQQPGQGGLQRSQFVFANCHFFGEESGCSAQAGTTNLCKDSK